MQLELPVGIPTEMTPEGFHRAFSFLESVVVSIFNHAEHTAEQLKLEAVV